MSFVKWKIEHTPFEENEWDMSKTTEIPRARNLNLIQEMGDTKDKFSFTTTNFNGELNNYFNPNDKIAIYRTSNATTFTPDDVLMVGTIKDTPIDSSGSRADLKVEGYNFSESVFGAIVFFEAVNKTPPEIIKQALNNAATNNLNFKVEWHPDNDTAISGITYPEYTERFFNKTLRKILEKYSAKPKVGDNKPSYYYVDKDNRLVWRPQTETVDYSFNYDSNAVRQIKFGKDTKGIKNYIILKGGQDASGHQIQTRYVDYSSVSKHGTKYYFLISENNTAKNLIDTDIANTYGDDPSPDGYPDITAVAFTTAWKSQANQKYTTSKYNVEVIPGQTITINTGSQEDNRKAYNEVVREEIKRALKAEGEAFARARAFGKLEVELEFRAGEMPWLLGNLITCTLPQLGVTDKPLRVQDVQYTTESDTFTLIEDEGSL